MLIFHLTWIERSNTHIDIKYHGFGTKKMLQNYDKFKQKLQKSEGKVKTNI